MTSEGLHTNEADYFAFADAVRAALREVAPTAKLEIVGSVARGEAVPPYSDLDLLLVAPEGEGQTLRDRVPDLAGRLGELLTIFVDPFSSQGCFCSVYSGLLKVDWFVEEESRDGRKRVWTGRQPPPTDDSSHPWDWTWWLWGKVRTGKLNLAAEELSKLWQFLVLRGAPPNSFPATVPRPGHDDLVAFVLRTLDHLPEAPMGAEVRSAIEEDARVRLNNEPAV